MLHIEPVEEVVTKRKLVIEIDEDEIAKILVDPRGFQKELRKQKSKWYGPAAYMNNGHVRAKKAKAARKATEKKIGQGQRREVPEVPHDFQTAGSARLDMYGEQRSIILGACAIAARRIG